MAYELFQHEKDVIAAARQRLGDSGAAADGILAAYDALLKEYERLLKTTNRLMRLSDRNERELNAMAEQHRTAAEEVARKNAELEVLSRKLSKYLAPQVYSSIFSGRQAVEIASQRKKLTVFFSDIVDFTRTTERLESEDLTQLLNHYLTEMTQVALAFGATIDKYIGDAIMLFFGDPESRGVKEDAIACVSMALAMQRRMGALEAVWHDAGIEKPLRCRIGISTGYCTVGNFGSEDRMDYTIIGGGVNLASRLQTAAPPGGIYISYETYAHVKDAIHCIPRGEKQFAGIAAPVAVFEAVETQDEHARNHRILREDRPNLRLDIDLDRLSDAERSEIRVVLETVLLRLR